MKILHWTPSYPPSIGGIETLVAAIGRQQTASGHTVAVMSADGAGDPIIESDGPVAVHRINSRRSLYGGDLVSFAKARAHADRVHAEFAPDVVHAHLSEPTVALQIAQGRISAPIVLTLHNTNFERGLACDEGSLTRSAIDAATAVTAVSEAVADDLASAAKHLSARAEVIPNGLEFAPVDPVPLPKSPPVICCLGRLDKQKGFDIAIDAMALVRDRLDARMIIAGDGPEDEVLRSQAARIEPDPVSFVGPVARDRVPHLLNTATVVAMPSRYEGLPIVALEAAAMARPVVGARVSGLTEAVRHGQTGLLLDKATPVAFAEALVEVLGDPCLATNMGHAGRAWVRREFSIERCTTRYEDLYRRVLR